VLCRLRLCFQLETVHSEWVLIRSVEVAITREVAEAAAEESLDSVALRASVWAFWACSSQERASLNNLFPSSLASSDAWQANKRTYRIKLTLSHHSSIYFLETSMSVSEQEAEVLTQRDRQSMGRLHLAGESCPDEHGLLDNELGLLHPGRFQPD
jgi:hypothetical protein